MRILITTETFGGLWTYARELSLGLLGEDCAVALVSLGRIPNATQLDWVTAQVSRWGSRFRFAACDVPLEWMQNNCHALSEAERLLQRIAREFRADLLVSSQYCFGALPGDLPRLVVAHSDLLSRAQVCRNQPLPETAWLARYRSLVAAGLRGADALVAPTQWMLHALAANFQLPRQVRVISHGRTLAYPGAHAERRLQAVAGLGDEGKNLKLLEQLEPHMPLLVAGETEPESWRLKLACGQAVPLGALDEEELLALFRQSSIYICTSQYEPFGWTPLEAALCGCAVLANDIPSLREVWGDAALFYHDAASLSALLAMLAGDRRLLDRVRSRSRRHAQQFTGQRMAAGYLQVFQEILQPIAAEHFVA